jgi:hypothetical protein
MGSKPDMNRRRGSPWLLAGLAGLLCVVGASGALAADKKRPRKGKSGETAEVYRWVDENGVTHYGDQIPPEYAPQDRDVLNQYGVAVRTEQGAMTDEERAAEEKAKAEKRAAILAARRDEVLLSTYLSVEEIEALRNRRIELIGGQIAVTENYLQYLREKLKQLQAEAMTFRPYSKDPEALPIEPQLAQELTDTVESIELYERTLVDTRTRKGRIMLTFNADIQRFKELKGL